MKARLVSALALLCIMAGSCKDKEYPDRYPDYGYVVISDLAFNLETEDLNTKAKNGSLTEDQFHLFFYDSQKNLVEHVKFGDITASNRRVLLKTGEYDCVARSCEEELPYATWEDEAGAIYGDTQHFTIEAGKETAVVMQCAMLQTKVTVDYTEDFFGQVAGNGKLTVTVKDGYPLDYILDYSKTGDDVEITTEKRAGYFAVEENSIMVVTYEGYMKDSDSPEGYKLMSMTKTFEGIKSATWHKITFQVKQAFEGNADFYITIDDFVDDGLLNSSFTASEEEGTSPDPNAPVGDGGIQLISTCDYDLTQPIVVPAAGKPFVLTMRAEVPNKVKKFVVDIESTNPDFPDAVGLINDGNTTLDLVNPSAGAIEVFTTILPFPYGDSVKDQTSIEFDLSDAQTPILGFAGEHTFIMTVSDAKGCKKSIPVVLVVE